MQSIFKHLSSALVIIVFFALALASATAKDIDVSKQTGQIPPDFQPGKDTLLVVTNTLFGIGVSSTIRSSIKGYKGPYLLVKYEDLKNYDTSTYRYSIFLSHNPSLNLDEKGRPGPGSVSIVMEDRQSKSYYRSRGFHNHGSLMRRYAEIFNGMME
ncbi:hypothetical protein [Foetidibacter luteolus]|uniref:hypothetical protein n=1 Tax=Foetidibacter luteolus TaxID=2608880 RepID=UPI00129A8B1D|nr:hypothetical protein [Foetidibacter luteolus]